MDNQFDSKGGGQNIAQGDHAVGKQVNVTQSVSGHGCIFSGTGNVSVSYGISPALFAEYAGKLAVTDSALVSFFKILEEQQVPHSDLDSKLREIAGQYKELLARVGDDQAAKQAIEAGDYAKAEELLEEAAKQHSISAAETYAELARLQSIQLRYAKAAAYWQKAAALLPEDEKKDRAEYLGEAGYNLHRIAKHKEALPLWEQSLSLYREISDKAGEGAMLNDISQIYKARGDYSTALKYLEQSLAISQEIGDKKVEGATLNNISQIYHARGDYATALEYLEQSLAIMQEIGDKAGEGATLNNINIAEIHRASGDYDKALPLYEQNLVLFREIGDKAHEGGTLNNISQIYDAQGDYPTALKYLEQSLRVTQKIGDRAGEGTTLNNIGQIYQARGDYPTALKYLEQSLGITQEIGNRRGEAVTSWNIGLAYRKQGDLTKAESYISRAVQLAEEIGHPKKDEYREGLQRVRAKLKGL
ncbi:MAG: tetratricopeptide repeat protein [Candidatus Electronema sp. VV]